MPAGQCKTVTPPEPNSVKRLVVLAGEREAGDTCRTFIFHQENHTLGNALRHVLLQNTRVMFAGYSIPHPAEDQMHIRYLIPFHTLSSNRKIQTSKLPKSKQKRI